MRWFGRLFGRPGKEPGEDNMKPNMQHQKTGQSPYEAGEEVETSNRSNLEPASSSAWLVEEPIDIEVDEVLPNKNTQEMLGRQPIQSEQTSQISRQPPRISIITTNEPEPPHEYGEETQQPSPNSLNPQTPISYSSDSSKKRRRADSVASSGTEKSELKSQLQDARVEGRREHSYFIPRCSLSNLITTEAIAKDIVATNPKIEETTASQDASRAWEKAKKLYGVLALNKKGPDISKLLDEGLCDKDLPLVRCDREGDKGYTLQRRSATGNVPIKALETWTDKQLEKFDWKQHWVTAPEFKYLEHYELERQAILPFISLKQFDTGKPPRCVQGGYSEVFPVRIFPSHHNFWVRTKSENDEPLVAVKQLYSTEQNEFEKEQYILKQLGPRRHPHLIRLLATYKQDNKYHLMFPFASANLRKYWEDHANPIFDGNNISWSLKQMTGFASALVLIHNFRPTQPLSVPGLGQLRLTKDAKLSVEKGEEKYGRHGDIKPENILHFMDSHETNDAMGVLQIADFGLGRFHGRESRSNVNPDEVAGSPTYEPPECKLHHPVSRAYDIWSLGCIYLEFVTWLLKGSGGIEEFSECRAREAKQTIPNVSDDNFYTLHFEPSEHVMTATIREGVVTWVDDLHSHPNCTQVIHELLDLVMKELLIIETSERSKVVKVHERLQAITMASREKPGYMLEAVPRESRNRTLSAPATLEPSTAGQPRVTFLDQLSPQPEPNRTDVAVRSGRMGTTQQRRHTIPTPTSAMA